MVHQVATTGLSLLTNQPRQQLLARTLDEKQLAAHTNFGMSLASALEFTLAPTLGALSDRMGRRPFMLGAPIVGLPTRLLAALWPSARVLLAERVASDACRAFAGTTLCYASLADLCQGDSASLVPAVASCNSAMGAGMVLAPLLSSAVARRGGGPRTAFVLAVVLTALQLLFEWRRLRETRSRSSLQQRQGPSHPFSFLRLFASGAKVRALSVVLALQIAVDGKLLQDQISLLQLVHAKWTLGQRSLWTSAFGGVIMLGGQLTKPVLAKLGSEQALASVAHAASVLGFLAYSRGLFWLGLLPLVIGQQRRTPTISWLLAEAEAAGIGRGEMLAMTANLRALVESLGPLIYGAVQRATARRGAPMHVFYLPAVLAAVAEAVQLIAHGKS